MGRPFEGGNNASLPVSDWEFEEIVERVNRALSLPKPHRGDRLRSIASEYGVSVRTLYRWRGKKLYPVKVGPYCALFSWRKGAIPVRVTGWERAA
jgi:hypothetical protein